MNKLEEELQEKERIIAFLKWKFEKETGREVIIPMSESELYKGIAKLAPEPAIDEEGKEVKIFEDQNAIPEEMKAVWSEDSDLTFGAAIHSFNLPWPHLIDIK